VRRIVTEEADGRSRVAIDGPAPRSWCDEIWATSPDHPLGPDPLASGDLEPGAGRTRFRVVALPPDAEMRAFVARRAPAGVAADGFHRTATVDYVVVLDGPVELVLDEGSVTVEPGDCVVQRGTNHAWRNHGTQPVRLLTVMVGTT
jgi:mannose-6-phosphate isomerase-like protein (cupin superfamily)